MWYNAFRRGKSGFCAAILFSFGVFMQNHYQLLGTANFASIEEIQKAFNRLYADLFTSGSPLANIPRLKELKDAFDILNSPELRAGYDAKLRDFLHELDRQYEKAVDALAAEKYDDSIALLKSCLKVNPREPDFYETLGLAYQLSERLDEAVKCFQQGLQLNLRNASFHRYLGDIYRIRRDDDKADTHYLDAAEGFKEMLKVDPKNISTLELLADTYGKMRWYDEAIEVFEKLIEQHPFRAEYHRDIGGIFYELDRLEEAEVQLLEALRSSPGDSSALLYLGLVYFKRRLLGLAVRNLEDSLKSKPDQPEVLKLIEKIREIAGEVGRTVEEIIYDVSPDAVVEGIIKWYNIETGVGVLSCPEYPEVLLHFSALKPEDQETIAKGDRVRFGVVKDKIGPVAVQIEKIDAAKDGDTLPGVILRFDPNRKIGIVQTASGREIVFPFSALAQDLLEKLEIGTEVLFETKSLLGISDAPIEQATNIRRRKKKPTSKKPPIPAI